MPTDEELVEQGVAIFRGIVGRARQGLCVARIARDRLCPRPSVGDDRSLYCEAHRQAAEEVDARIERQMNRKRRPDHPKDTCKCGDYRHSHALGRGFCGICRWEYQPLGYACQQFRMAKRAPKDAPVE